MTPTQLSKEGLETVKSLCKVVREFKKLLLRRRTNVDQKMNLYFTYESRDTLKSFTLFITVKPITKLNLGHRNKFEKEFKNQLSQFTFFRQRRIGHFTSVVVLQRTAKKCSKSYNARAQLLFFSLNLNCLATFSLPLPSWLS